MSSLQSTVPSGSLAAPAGAGPSRKKAGPGLHWWSTRVLPLVPAVTMLLVFLAFPIIWSLYSSFTNIALTGSRAANPEFIGLGNYERLLQDPVFPKSVWLTVVFVLFSAILGQNILGLFLALVMRRASRAVSTLTSTVVIVAWILPEIVAAFAMYAFFIGEGTLNQALALVGIEGPSWLFAHPMVAVIFANTWRGTAFSMMIYQAALSSVPPEVGEAARIDGATTLRELFSITLPMIRNSIATNLMLITLQTLSVFTIVFVMTAGGPSNRSMILPVYAYDQAFGFLDIGYGSAIATVMLLVGVVFGVIYVRLLRPGRD